MGFSSSKAFLSTGIASFEQAPQERPKLPANDDPTRNPFVLPPNPEAQNPEARNPEERLAEANARRALRDKHGGTDESDQAVDLALQWLVRHQLPSGQWSLTGDNPTGKAKYTRGA